MVIKQPLCGDCKYHGFWKLAQWCRHPAHVEPLQKRMFTIIQNNGKCSDRIDWSEKINPGQPFLWPRAVSLVERFGE